MTGGDAEARHRLSTDLETTYFVEAGAGTGKTRELVARVVALVARGRVTMPRLAAITFTEAAAAELRDRIRRELEQAARPDSSWTTQERERCLEGARSIDLAHVQTIHSFAGDLLRTFPLEACLPPGFAIWDEMQRDADFDERFRAWLYDEVPRSDSPERRETVARALALGFTPDKLKLLAHRLQEHYDLLEPGTAWQRPALPDSVRVANTCGQDLHDLEPLFVFARDGEADPMVAQLRRLEFTVECLRTARTEAEAFEALLRYELKHPTQMVSWLNRWALSANGDQPLKQIRETLRQCNESIAEAIESHRSNVLANILSALSEFTLDYAADRKMRGVVTFHDLLVWARDLLRDHAEARLAAHRRFDRLFVDEFQDTDPLQAELVAFLAADPEWASERNWRLLLDHLVPGYLFVVGDPKQSIYRFRRADVGVYQRVYGASGQAGASQATLSQTFRAIDPIVGWVNAYFESAMVFETAVQAEYARLESRPELDGVVLDTGACGVRCVGGPDDLAAGERWALEADAIARLANRAVAEQWQVSQKVDGAWQIHPAAFSDICILLPTRSNLRRLERAFERHQVPYRMESGSLVLATQEVRDLLACLRSIEDPSDQVALVAALKSPAYGCSDVDLLRWVDAGGRLDYVSPGSVMDGPVASGLASLLGFHRARASRSASATIEAVLQDRGLNVLALDHPRPREAVRRQRYVVAQARRLAAAGDPTLRGFVQWIETLRRNELYDAESAVPDSDENAVRLMTVHGSKGLEFPIVILSGLGGGGRPSDGVQLLADRHSGRLEARVSARIGEAFHTANFDGEREKRLAQAEALRLLYVAATRAREHLVLCLFHSVKYGKATHAAAICQRLPHLGDWRPVEIPLAELQSQGPIGQDGTEAMPAALTPTEHMAAEVAWVDQRSALLTALGSERHATPSGLAHEALLDTNSDAGETDTSESIAESAGDAISPRASRPPRAATALGLAVHAVLQWVDLDTLADLDGLAAWSAAEHGLDPATVAEVATLARHAAESEPVREAVASARFWREVPLSVELDGVLIDGTIDLLYEAADGALVVVDYKTDRVSGQALSERADSYRRQGRTYADALTRATGHPVDRVTFVFAAARSDSAVSITEPQRTPTGSPTRHA